MGVLRSAPRAAKQQSLLTSLHAAGVPDKAWVGGHDLVADGVWTWERDNRTFAPATFPDLAFSNWGEGQPDNYGGEQDCMIITTSQQGSVLAEKWVDEKCTDVFAYACELLVTPPAPPPFIDTFVAAVAVALQSEAAPDVYLGCDGSNGMIAPSIQPTERYDLSLRMDGKYTLLSAHHSRHAPHGRPNACTHHG